MRAIRSAQAEKFRHKNYPLEIAVALAIGLPFAAIGAIACLTIILIPLGLILCQLSGWPLGYVMERHHKKKVAWQKRDRPLPPEEGIDVPWLMEQTEPDA